MPANPQDAITVTAYATFEHAYQWLSERLFLDVLGQPLPRCLLTFQRRRAAYGYFCRDRFAHRHDESRRVDEIALNPDLFPGRSDQDILSTLAHEGVHLYQRWHGRPGRRGYHNRQWAQMMQAIGLMPSTTGSPGGQTTGEYVSHYIVPGGAFAQTVDALLATGFGFQWQSATPSVHRTQPGEAWYRPRWRSKTPFACPSCHQKAWAKPTATLVCGTCKRRMSAS